MKKILFIFLLSISFAPTAIVSAHVLKTDGTMGAVLHVDPNDSPVAGKSSSIFFDLKDSSGKFTIENCDCTVSVAQNGKTIFDRKIVSLAPVSFTFPEIAVYDVRMTGAAKDGVSFDPFTLSYDIRVETAAPRDAQADAINAESQNFFERHWLHIVLFGGAIIFAIFSMVRESRKK